MNHHPNHQNAHPPHYQHQPRGGKYNTSQQHAPSYQSNVVEHPTNSGPSSYQDGRIGSRGGGQQMYHGYHQSTENHPVHQDAYQRRDDIQHNQHHHGQRHHSRPPMGRGDNRRDNRPMYPPNNQMGNNPPLFGNNPPRGVVMMVYGLPAERLNCDRLFNLFCLYGNVARIKFLRSKQGCAMVQMGDVAALDRCVGSLNRLTLFGADLQLSYSKQPFLHEVSQPFILPDGSPSFRDFMNSKNNRFNNPNIASKNRILPPSHVLHFFNAPLGITEDELVHLFEQTAGHSPVSIKIFTPKTENSKSFSGLAVFRDQIEATEALILCNHISVPKADGQHPYILRLCFSPPNYPRSPYTSQHDSQTQQQPLA